MPPASSVRLAVVAALVAVAVAVFAAAGSGSSSFSPPAQAPRLLAHDTTSFLGHTTPSYPATGRPGPMLLPPRRARTGRRLASATNVMTFAGGTTSAAAPNANGDIGLTQFLQAVDGEYSIYSRTGALLAAVTNTAFWSGLSGPDGAGLCATHPQGQASVVYDRVADRFVVAESAFAGSRSTPSGPFDECIAVSSTGDATGAWHRYVFQISTSVYPDMSSLGAWSDGYYLSFNQLTSTGSWAGVGAVAFQRSTMLNGAASAARYFNLQNTIGVGGMLPASNGGVETPTAGPELFLQAHEDLVGSNDYLELWGFHTDWTGTGSTFQPLEQIPVTPFSTQFGCGSSDACVFQSGTAPLLDTGSRAHVAASEALPQLGGQLMYGQNGSLETLAVADTVAAGSVAGVRWYRLQNAGSGWSVAASGTYAPPTSPNSTARFTPAAAFDNIGEVALGYTQVTGGSAPILAFTNANDPSVGDVQAVTGYGAPHPNSTWGRSTSLRLDPIGLCSFWLTGPAAAGDGSWYSQIASFSFSGCSPAASQPRLTADPTWSSSLVREGQTITGTPASFTGAVSTAYAWQRCDSAGLNCVDINGENGTSHTISAADAAGDRTLRFEETATNSYGSSAAVSIATPVVQSIPPTNTALPVISGTAATGQLLSVSNGSWTSSSPLAFTYRWRRCASGTCTDIPGATASTYTPTSADIGSTLDAVVSATNTGGGTDAISADTGTVIAGTTTTTASGPADLKLTASAAPASATIGQNITLFYTVTDQNALPAMNLQVTLTLPAGLAYAGSYAERGPGCVAGNGSQVVCNLAYVSAQTPVTRVQVYVTVKDAGTQTVSATATFSQADANGSDNTASVSIAGSSSGTSTSTTNVATGGVVVIPTSNGIPVGLNGAIKSVAGADRKAPTVHALRSAGRRGRSAPLEFRIYDDSGIARATATVERNGKPVGSAATGFGPVAAGSIYYVGWHVPAKARKGRYSFCVVAVDRARHSSKQSCAPLTLR